MAVNFSIKQVPEDVADRLRERAERNHRSLQGELRAILDAAVSPAGESMARERSVAYTPALGERGQVVAPQSESALMIREDRDGRNLTIDDLHERVSSLGRGTPSESATWVRALRSRR